MVPLKNNHFWSIVYSSALPVVILCEMEDAGGKVFLWPASHIYLSSEKPSKRLANPLSLECCCLSAVSNNHKTTPRKAT